MAAATKTKEPEWAQWSDEQLLDFQMSDLGLTIQGSPLVKPIRQLYAELAARHLLFRPHVWLAEEWFTPDGVSGIAIPFYLAHSRLMRLELKQMLEVEGGTTEWCMRILRHEAGHAIENAYRLRRRRQRQQIFGHTTQPYPDCYAPKPYSKSFVIHLDRWYAQSHPDEDFAETFAVWLAPEGNWRERYAGWPAKKKLKYMDALMREISRKAPVVTAKTRIDPLRSLNKTLREHYQEKRERFGLDHPNFYEQDFGPLFSSALEFKNNRTAVNFLGRIRKDVRRKVSAWTGAYQYTIDQVLKDMIEFCREKNLRLAIGEDQAKIEFTVLLTVQTMNYLHSGRHRVAL